MYDVSLSIVTYNNEKTIRNTLESITGHMDEGFEYVVFVVDNNSRDRTVGEVEDTAGNIVLIKNTRNIGFGAGHNIVLDRIDSKYHVVVNPDITIKSGIIREMAGCMDTNPDIGLMSPLIKFPNGEIQYLCKHNPTFIDLAIRLIAPNSFRSRQDWFEMRETGYDKMFDIEYASGCFMFFRTEIFKRIGGFDENIFLYLEDADITRRVNQISRTVFYPYGHVVHEWQRGAHKDPRLMWINIKSAAYYFKKWGFRLF